MIFVHPGDLTSPVLILRSPGLVHPDDLRLVGIVVHRKSKFLTVVADPVCQKNNVFLTPWTDNVEKQRDFDQHLTFTNQAFQSFSTLVILPPRAGVRSPGSLHPGDLGVAVLCAWRRRDFRV